MRSALAIILSVGSLVVALACGKDKSPSLQPPVQPVQEPEKQKDKGPTQEGASTTPESASKPPENTSTPPVTTPSPGSNPAVVPPQAPEDETAVPTDITWTFDSYCYAVLNRDIQGAMATAKAGVKYLFTMPFGVYVETEKHSFRAVDGVRMDKDIAKSNCDVSPAGTAWLLKNKEKVVLRDLVIYPDSGFTGPACIFKAREILAGTFDARKIDDEPVVIENFSEMTGRCGLEKGYSKEFPAALYLHKINPAS